MENVGENGSSGGRNERRKPEKIIIFDDKVGKNCI